MTLNLSPVNEFYKALVYDVDFLSGLVRHSSHISSTYANEDILRARTKVIQFNDLAFRSKSTGYFARHKQRII